MASAPAVPDIVPLGDRMRYLRLFRLGAAAFALIFGPFAGDTHPVDFGWIVMATAAYLAVTMVIDLASETLQRQGLPLFGGLLMVDGIYLAWTSYATGGSVSPIRFLVFLHLVAVVLLASYRTGLKLAVWHSLLFFVVFYAQEADILEPVAGAVDRLPGSEYERLTGFIIALWLVGIATAAFSAVNERELRRRRFDLEALALLGSELEGAADSFDVADVLLQRIADTFDLDRMLLLGAPDVDLLLLARRGTETPIGSVCPTSTDSVIIAGWEARRTLLVSELDPDADPWLAEALPDSRNLLVTPMTAEGRTIGVLIMEHALRHGSRVERRVVSMVERFASHASLALRNAWLLEQVQRMATTDGLTGIANRRSFDSTLEREISRAARNGDPVSLVMLDLDHFKKLNDEHGHQVGDEVLRQIADALATCCRDFDTPARYGGEEFAVVMPGCSVDDCLGAAERFRRKVAVCDSVVPVTASLGVAAFPAHAGDTEALLRAADEALYESKRAGRNRVTVARTNGQAPGPGPESETTPAR